MASVVSSMRSRNYGLPLYANAANVAIAVGHGRECSVSHASISLALALLIPIPINAFTLDSRQEPYEVVLRVRICAEGRW
jgi:hypothetical protein